MVPLEPPGEPENVIVSVRFSDGMYKNMLTLQTYRHGLDAKHGCRGVSIVVLCVRICIIHKIGRCTHCRMLDNLFCLHDYQSDVQYHSDARYSECVCVFKRMHLRVRIQANVFANTKVNAFACMQSKQ